MFHHRKAPSTYHDKMETLSNKVLRNNNSRFNMNYDFFSITFVSPFAGSTLLTPLNLRRAGKESLSMVKPLGRLTSMTAMLLEVPLPSCI